jgi:hypothetical protein
MVLAMMASIFAVADEASAQSSRRQDLNLFGRGLREPEQSLILTGNLGGTFYDTLLQSQIGPDGTRLPNHGWGSFGSGALAYRLRLLHVTFDGALGGFATYYPALDKPFRATILPNAGASTGWAWTSKRGTTSVTSSASLQLSSISSQFASFEPRGSFQTNTSDPNSAFLPNEATFVEGDVLSTNAGVSATHAFSRRVSAVGSYSYLNDRTFGTADTDQPTFFDIRNRWGQNASASLVFAVTRHLSVRGGYRHEESHYADGTYRTNTLDVGVDYGRGVVLQLTRRTTVDFSGGVTAYVDRAGHQRFTLTGTAGLTHDFKRTWSSGIRFSRGLDSSEILFNEPVLNDRFTAFVDGLLTRRIGAHAYATAENSTRVFSGSDAMNLRTGVTAGIQTTLTRRIAFAVDYSCYYYRFGDAVGPAGVPNRSASQGVFAYLSTAIPVFQRGGRRDVAR